MSLPIPSTTGGGMLDAKTLQAIDAPLVALTNSCGGDLRKLLYAFFSFLHRRTDFYLVPHDEEDKATMGFREGDAEKLLLAAFRQFPLRRIPQKIAASAAAAQQQQPSPSTAKASATQRRDLRNPVQTNDDSSADSKKTAASASENEIVDLMQGVRLNDEGLQIPVGNGGSTKRYKWTQTMDECNVMLGVGDNLRGKDLAVSIKPKSVSIRTKQPLLPGSNSAHVFMEGDLTETVVPDESTWSLEGGILSLLLYKQTKSIWKAILVGDDEIDTTLVDNRRHVHEYDEETQAQIRKIIFDQNQARKGLPSSDELSGKQPTIPPVMPPGVEYINQETLDAATAAAAAANDSK